MDTGDGIRLLLLGVAVLFSAFFAGSEAAFLSLQRSKLAAMVSSNKKGADRVTRIASHPEKLLATVLTGNNLVNVAAAALGTALATTYLSPNWAVGASVGGITLLLLLLGEILPKTIAAKNAESLAVVLVRPLQIAEVLFFPVVWFLERFSRLVSRLFALPGTNLVTEAEIRGLIELAELEGTVATAEADMMEKVFHFGDRQVQEVMTPRTEVVWVEKDATLQEFLDIYKRNTHTRFPVFDGEHENILGILSIHDLLKDLTYGAIQPDESVTATLRSALFVPETKRVAQLFEELKRSGQQAAIAIDEYGGVAGLVTLKSLIEVITGDIGEEGEPAEENFVAVGERHFDVSADMPLSDANENLDMGLPEGNYRTLAGFILERLGRIPQDGETLQHGNIRLRVTEMRGMKIERVEAWLSDQAEE